MLDRIVSDPAVMAGQPVVQGTRLTVPFLLGSLAHGASEADVLSEYDRLTPDDIRACVLFATRALTDTRFAPLAA